MILFDIIFKIRLNFRLINKKFIYKQEKELLQLRSNMKKIVNLLCSSLLVCSLSAYAGVVPIAVLGRCNSTLYPVSDQDIALSTTGQTPGKISGIEYKTTDPNGVIYLDETHHGKLIKIYLAIGHHTVNVDCGSRLTPVELGIVVLGENGSLCPSFCPKH